jgi:hypothetical protein
MIQQARNLARLSPIPGFFVTALLQFTDKKWLFEAKIIASHLE